MFISGRPHAFWGYNITFKNCSIQTVICGAMGNSKTHVSTSNLEFIAFEIL